MLITHAQRLAVGLDDRVAMNRVANLRLCL